MSVARLKCRAQIGLTAPEVEVEVHLGSGLPTFSIVGLAATAVKESKERVRAALVNSGLEFPAGRITVNLAPADLPKDGGRFDLAIAVGIALASGQVSRAHGELQPDDALEFYGELGLGGEVRAVPGMLLAARCATQAQRALIMPAESALETLLVPDCSAWCADTLLAVCEHLQGTRELHPPAIAAPQLRSAPSRPLPSLDDVCGQALAKRALVVAAAGGHSLLLVGPPGCGKTLLAQRLTTLLPPLTQSEALDVATIASIAGQRGAEVAQPARPFRAPHHTASATAIVGGGPRARPGDVTLAHHGVLFLDEFPEFDRRVLEALREPLENGAVSIARASCHAEYPARFQLIAAIRAATVAARRRSCCAIGAGSQARCWIASTCASSCVRCPRRRLPRMSEAARVRPCRPGLSLCSRSPAHASCSARAAGNSMLTSLQASCALPPRSRRRPGACSRRRALRWGCRCAAIIAACASRARWRIWRMPGRSAPRMRPKRFSCAGRSAIELDHVIHAELDQVVRQVDPAALCRHHAGLARIAFDRMFVQRCGALGDAR